MATKPKALTTQKVHAVLNKAGFSSSRWIASSRVRGWGRWSYGYRLWKETDGTLKLNHQGQGNAETMKARYRDALHAAGLVTTEVDGDVTISVPAN